MIFVLTVSQHASMPIVNTEPEVILQKGTRGVLPCRVGTAVALVYWHKGPTFSTGETVIGMDTETRDKVENETLFRSIRYRRKFLPGHK